LQTICTCRPPIQNPHVTVGLPPARFCGPHDTTRIAESGKDFAVFGHIFSILRTPLIRDARGYESQFAANHLGHFQLTVRLWPALLNAHGARVVSLSSRGHQRANVDFDDLNFEHRPYDKWQAYGQSKTANILFAVELDRRGEPNDIRAFAVHPGGIVTDLLRHMTDDELQGYGLPRADLHGSRPAGNSVDEGGFFKSLEQGAATTLWAATNPQLNGKGGV